MPVGEHTYVVTYLTDRQMGFYKDRDELYWNSPQRLGLSDRTCNGDGSPADQYPATIGRDLRLYGPAGYQGRDFTAKHQDDLSYLFETSKPLAAHEGLRRCWWDKGYMQPPTSDQERSWFYEDNQGLGVCRVRPGDSAGVSVRVLVEGGPKIRHRDDRAVIHASTGNFGGGCARIGEDGL